MRILVALVVFVTLAAGAAVAQNGAPAQGMFNTDDNTYVYLQGPQGPRGETGVRGPQGKPGKRIVVYRENKRCLYELRSKGPRAMQWVCISTAQATANEARDEARRANRRIDDYEAMFGLGNVSSQVKALIVFGLIALIMVSSFIAFRR